MYTLKNHVILLNVQCTIKNDATIFNSVSKCELILLKTHLRIWDQTPTSGSFPTRGHKVVRHP